MKKTALLTSIFILLSTVTCLALKEGDSAPEIQVASWIKNGPIDLKNNIGKKIFIVEFWSTECKPCIQAMPYLQRLQKEFKNDLQIISISTESATVVKNFIAPQKRNKLRSCRRQQVQNLQFLHEWKKKYTNGVYHKQKRYHCMDRTSDGYVSASQTHYHRQVQYPKKRQASGSFSQNQSPAGKKELRSGIKDS